ncbi:MAG TPA: TSUP family transporter [Polyangiales bacterium]|nr:TSUP family transporter [Polyangiales bacterium]
MDWFIWIAVFATSALSGVFGMAGGMLLLLLLTARMPLADAMVLHGSAQLVANGVRAALLARHVRYDLVLRYVGAGVLAVALCGAFGIVVDAAFALILTGLVGCAEPWFARLRMPSIEQPHGVLTAGALVSALHVTSGATGPVLDAFFARSSLARHQNVATKALLQCSGHVLKIAYFVLLAGGGGKLDLAQGFWLIALASVGGTMVGRKILDRVDEAFFRRGTRILVRGLGAASLIRGAFALAL